MQLLFGAGRRPSFPARLSLGMDSPWAQSHGCYRWTILFMRPTFYYLAGMASDALRRIAAPVLGFPTHNPTHKKYVLYDFRVLWQSPRSCKFCKTYPCYLDTVEVWGSSPHGPTIICNGLDRIHHNPQCARLRTQLVQNLCEIHSEP